MLLLTPTSKILIDYNSVEIGSVL